MGGLASAFCGRISVGDSFLWRVAAISKGPGPQPHCCLVSASINIQSSVRAAPAALCRDNPAWHHWLVKEQRLHELAASTIVHCLPKLKQLAADAIKEGCTELKQQFQEAALSGTLALDSNAVKRLTVLNTFLPATLSVLYPVRVLDILRKVNSAMDHMPASEKVTGGS